MEKFKLNLEPEKEIKDKTKAAKKAATKKETKVSDAIEEVEVNDVVETESTEVVETPKPVPISIGIETTKINLLNYVKTDERSGIFTIPNTPWVVLTDKKRPDGRPKIYNFRNTYAVGLGADNCYVSHDLKKKEIYYKYIIDENRFLVVRFRSKKKFICEIVSIENRMLTNFSKWEDDDGLDKVRNIKIDFHNTFESLSIGMADESLIEAEKVYLSVNYKINKLSTVKDVLTYVGKKCKAGWHQNYLRRIFDIANMTWKNHF